MEDPPSGSPLERLRFGLARTLNVRTGMYTGADAAARVETWLRSKQVELTGDVLIITGRGKGSPGGIPVVRDATRKVLARLRRSGVIAEFGEDTPGSFVATLAPLRSLLEAPARRETRVPRTSPKEQAIRGLRAETRQELRYLAARALDALGIRDASEDMLSAEMARQFSVLARAAPGRGDSDRWLHEAISRAVREYDDS